MLPAASKTLTRATSWILCGLLFIAYFLLRVPHLRDLPIFCDEATYLRWAQLIHADPIHNYWVSMADAKLPMHYWILALFYPLGGDPVWMGRFVSVLFGAAMIPVLLAMGREFQRLLEARNASATTTAAAVLFGPIATVFMITSPLIADFQRMALAEPLLLLESVIIAWLSLRLSRLIDRNAARRVIIRESIVLGLAWAATLLTKQNFSYLFWILPILATCLYCTRTRWRRQLTASITPLLLATFIGLVFFIPAVFTTSLPDLSLRLFYKPNFFRVPGYSRLEILAMNAVTLLSPRVNKQATWWPHDPAAPLNDGSLYLYLTPPVFIMLVAGLFWLYRRRAYTPLAFFGIWALALCGTVVANHSWIRTRYVLLGIFPLLLLAAWIAADGLATIQSRFPRARRIIAVPLLTTLLAWPLLASIAQLIDFSAPTRTRMDRAEYLTGASGGAAIQDAVNRLIGEAAIRPITVITHPDFGLENDFVWLSLAGNPNVQLLCTNDFPLKPDAATHEIVLGTEQWVFERTSSVYLDPQRPTYTLLTVGTDDKNELTCNPRPETLSASGRLVKIYANPPLTLREKPSHGIAIVQLRDAPSLAGAIPPSGDH